jgi:Amt family ammonium transporter
LKIDDPVGAISVHGICGVWGTLSVGLFGQRAIDVQFWSDTTAIRDGLFYGGGLSQLLIQLKGIAASFVLAFGLAMLVFAAIKATIGLRVSDEEQREGLDLGEHGQQAYPDFVVTQPAGVHGVGQHAHAMGLTAAAVGVPKSVTN